METWTKRTVFFDHQVIQGFWYSILYKVTAQNKVKAALINVFVLKWKEIRYKQTHSIRIICFILRLDSPKISTWICIFGLIIHDLLYKVTFLYAERVDGPVAGVDDAVLCTSSHDSMVDWQASIFGDVQLPAKLPDKWQTHSSHLDMRGVREGGLERWRGECRGSRCHVYAHRKQQKGIRKE